MRLFALAVALFAAVPAVAQTTPVAPMPKGTGLPPPASEEAAVLSPIDALFQALEAGDAAAMLAQVYPDGRVTAVTDTAVRQHSFTQFAERVKPGHGFRERITDPAIEIDGNIAMVWAPFTVVVDGKLQSCGIDHFDLVREAGRWKVMNVTFSSRSTGCQAQ
jgi:hypothetical protein